MSYFTLLLALGLHNDIVLSRNNNLTFSSGLLPWFSPGPDLVGDPNTLFQSSFGTLFQMPWGLIVKFLGEL